MPKKMMRVRQTMPYNKTVVRKPLKSVVAILEATSPCVPKTEQWLTLVRSCGEMKCWATKAWV